MVDEEHPQTSRKRAADKQINKDNPELDDGSPEQEARTFKKASEEVMTTRTTVKVTSQQPPSAPSSNPFSAIRFTPSDSGVKGSIPVSKSPPSDVATSNVKGSASGDKANGCSNGSRKDADKNADSNEAAEVQKDESGMKELDAENKSNVPTGSNSLLIGTDSKAYSTGLGTGEERVLVVEPNGDNSKTWGIESKTEDGVAEEKKGLAMDDNGKSAHIMCDLADRHLQSVVCLKVWWRDWSTEGRRPIMPRATGSIIYSSQESMLILSCSTIFRNFTTCFGPAFDTIEILNENIFLEVGFFDGHSAMGVVYCISWWKDLCLVLIPFPERTYEPVKFIDDENLMDQSIYKRGTEVFSIFCIPNGQKILFGTTSNGKICGLPIIGNDLGPVYDPDLEFFEFTMPGAKECPGRPVFTDNLLVMGICTCRFDKLEFALTLDQIRRWLHDCFDIKMTSSMNKTVARLSRIISDLPVALPPTPHSPRQGLYPACHQDHLCPSQLTAQACPDAPLLPEAAKLVPKWLTMDDDRKSACIMCELADKHLQSVISLKVQCKYSSKEGRKAMKSYGTGSIIHSSKKFILILSSSKALRTFTTRPGPDFNSVGMLNENIILRVDFFDGHSAKGEVYCVDWWKDLCLVFVPYPKKSYVPVKFTDNENLMGQSFYKRATEVFSIFCFPTCQKDDKVLFGTTTNGKICGGPVIGKDLDPVYAPDLEFFEFDMPGSQGCYGAPVFNENLQVMGIWICTFGDFEFALKIDEVRRWLHDNFKIKATSSMNETITRVCARIVRSRA